MMKSKLVLFIILFLFSVSIVYFNKSKPVLLFKDFISETLKPAESILNFTKNKLSFWPMIFLNIKNLKELNIKLTNENLELYGKLTKLSQLEEENIFLRERLNLADKNYWDTSMANVIGRDFQNNRSFLIDSGSKVGIVIGMPVIISNGLVVGKITETSSNTSKVRSVIDLQSKIAVITSESKISGLVRGLGSDIVFDLIAKNKIPKPGELIISSGTDGLWPRGLLIGKVAQIHSEDNQIFNTADIELLTNFLDFNTVLVILNPSNIK